MVIAKTREATVNDMKSLEQQGGSTCTRDNNIDAIKQNTNPQCGKCGLNHGKKCSLQSTRCRKCNQWNHWEQVCRNKQTRGRKTKFEPQRQPVGRNPQDKESQGKAHTEEEINSDFDELYYESIQVAKIQVDLPNIDHPNPALKVKLESGAWGNVSRSSG